MEPPLKSEKTDNWRSKGPYLIQGGKFGNKERLSKSKKGIFFFGKWETILLEDIVKYTSGYTKETPS